jgi:hypothetical protein
MRAGARILAIDPSSSGTGLADGCSGETPKLESVRFKRDELDTVEQVFGRASSYFSDRLQNSPPDLVAIERPLVIARGYHHDPTLMIGIYAVITGLARARCIRVLPVAIAQWRKHFLGHGRLDTRAAKQQALSVCRALGWKAETHDCAEAAGIWLYACSTIAPMRAHRAEPLFTGVPE